MTAPLDDPETAPVTDGPGMPKTFRAAALRAPGEAMTIENVEPGALGSRDVTVKIRAAGLCHTDLEVIDGSLRLGMPAVLGHEAAGAVAACGPDAKVLPVLHGTADPECPPDHGRALADGLATWRLELWHGCGHVPMAEQPGVLAETLTAFASGCCAAVAS